MFWETLPEAESHQSLRPFVMTKVPSFWPMVFIAVKIDLVPTR